MFTRTRLLIGEEGLLKLKNSKVIVFGAGGVGSFCVEALVRAGIYHIHIVDKDTVSLTNLNRQLIATTKTLGEDKVDSIEARAKEINPNINIIKTKLFYTKDTQDEISFFGYDYIIDAIDTISSKILLVENAKKQNIPIISSMGTGNKLDPSLFEVADIYKTSVCPIARIMRYELKKRGIKSLKVVYSKEKPIKVPSLEDNKNIVPGSISFVPPVAGFILASQVVKDLLKK